MTREAQALAQALLDHHKRLRCGGVDVAKILESRLFSYGDLCERAGLPHLKPKVGKWLREIALWCHENGWPPLNALAVNHKTLRPGSGYGEAPGCNLDHWGDQVAACMGFTGYPEKVDE